jgi:hypothetical protein
MLNPISNPKNLSLLLIALIVLFIFPAGSAHASWPEVEKLLAADSNENDLFGISVSVSGDYAIVGAYSDDDNGTSSGSAYIFYYNGTSWNQQAKLTAADGNENDLFGISVSISGDYAILACRFLSAAITPSSGLIKTTTTEPIPGQRMYSSAALRVGTSRPN